MTAVKMTAADVQRAIYRQFSAGWAVVFEVSSSISDQARVTSNEKVRRIDALLVRRARARITEAQRRQRWQDMMEISRQQHLIREQQGQDGLFTEPAPALPPLQPAPPKNGGIERVALEIKVSRPDFFNDINDPSKQGLWRELADRHAFVVPRDMVTADEVPAGSGLYYAVPGRAVMQVRRAPATGGTAPLPSTSVLDAFYRWSRAEALTRGLDHEGRATGDDIEALRAELARLRHANDLLTAAHDRVTNVAEVWKQRFSQCQPPACGTCGAPLRASRKGTSMGWVNWVHTDADENLCMPLRAAASLSGRPGAPEPADGWDTVADLAAA